MLTWCEQLLLRLPELEWRLQAWPAGYKNWMPEGLFQPLGDLTPESSFRELRQHIAQLQQLDESTSKARFLAKKIAQQVDVLVELGKKAPKTYELNFQPGITRKQQLERLIEKKNRLAQQEQALQLSYDRLQLPVIQEEIKVIQQQLQQIENMLTRI